MPLPPQEAAVAKTRQKRGFGSRKPALALPNVSYHLSYNITFRIIFHEVLFILPKFTDKIRFSR